MLGLLGLVAGLVFGLAIAWGMLGPIFILIGMAVLLIGAFIPTPFRALFGAALFGFLVSWLVSSGLDMI